MALVLHSGVGALQLRPVVGPDLPPDARLAPGWAPNMTFVKYKNGGQIIKEVHMDDINDPKTSRSRFGDQQSNIKRQNALQYAYLTHAVESIRDSDSLQSNLQHAHEFASRLTSIAEDTIRDYVTPHSIVGVKPAELRVVGSLGGAFAVSDSGLKMTLLPHKQYPSHLAEDYPRLLEKTFLDLGIGARFLPNERMPVLQVCENPSPTVLRLLRGERYNWETGRSSKKGDWCGLELSKSDVGMIGLISFSKPLATHISAMMRCYDKCDYRVRLLVTFVKRWAKNRNINDPSNNTLSSIGYTLMVLHYLMNICNPPIIPNLQKQKDVKFRTKIIEGYKVGFYRNEDEIANRDRNHKMSRNTECVASLIQGFFRYYSSHGDSSPEGGFDWIRSTISIRTSHGLLPKSKKGWITGRRVNGHWKSYLLAIEDPFDLELNHGETVNKSGLSRIKAELSRADTIIRRVQYIPGAGMLWRNDDGLVGEHLLASVGAKSYQEGLLPLTKYPKPLVIANGPEETASAEPTPEPTHEDSQPKPRGVRAMMETLTHLKPQVNKREEQRKNGMRQVAMVAQEMRRIMGLPENETPGYASGSGSGDAGVKGPSNTAANQQQQLNVSKFATDDVVVKEGTNSDTAPSLSLGLSRESVDKDDWDSLRGWCGEETESNAELIAELPFVGMDISFKKDQEGNTDKCG
ncbi:hypothetical protein FQN54_002487 [Arachnomyces sp. PD_36]|nr:hypothetical protein FQN54_002487 [Arachnomyces sp. PD_36]